MIEVWKEINGFYGLYAVSNMGRIKSFDRILSLNGYIKRLKGKILKQQIFRNGYCAVHLSKNNIKKMYSVHRLVAQEFIPTPQTSEKLEVNHKDGDKTNNNIDNLEWITHKKNMQHSQNILGYNVPKPVMQIKDNKVIAIFSNKTEASKKTGVCEVGIRYCCHRRKHCRTAGGYEWQYVKPDDDVIFKGK